MAGLLMQRTPPSYGREWMLMEEKVLSNVHVMGKVATVARQMIISGDAHPLLFGSGLYAGIIIFFEQVCIVINAGWKLDHPHHTFLPERSSM